MASRLPQEQSEARLPGGNVGKHPNDNSPGVFSQASDLGEDDLILPSKPSTWNEATYAFGVAVVAGFACTIIIFLWSTPFGMASVTMHWLRLYGFTWYMYTLGIAILIFCLLYVVDFFCPPHLSGLHCMLWKGDYYVGRSILASALLLFVFSLYLMAWKYPSIPIVITLLAEPVFVGMFRSLTRPAPFEINHEQAQRAHVSKKVSMLQYIVVEEEDMIAFYKGCTVAFSTMFIACLMFFFASFPDAGSQATAKLGKTVAELCWSTPLIVAIANLLFAILFALRVGLQKSYARTNRVKSQLLLDTKESSMVSNLTNHRMSILNAKTEGDRRHSLDVQGQENSDRKQEFIYQHTEHVKSLLMYVKLAGIILFIFAGLTYCIVSFSNVDEDISNLVMGLAGVFVILLSLFFYSSLRRVAEAMGRWIRDLPAWKAAQKVKDKDWAKAFFTCIFLQLLPFVVIMSFLNQSVRRGRGLYENCAKVDNNSGIDHRAPSAAEGESAPADDGTRLSSNTVLTDEFKLDMVPRPETYRLTPRVSLKLSMIKSWNPYSVVVWIKVFCVLFICYYVVPPCANIVFSYLRNILQSVSFGFILILTFLIGVIAFLLPPVPGMTVYIFGGLIVADCREVPFWVGAFSNVLLCWFLKLVACAIQQKLIGENLGRTFYIRSLIGVHTLKVRCFESILKKRGWTLGKVALLCGGPDWPVSVTAGVLRLSLVQCEIGTIPIIVFVTPCALTGSLYKLRADDSNYDTLFKLMLFLSVATSGVMFAIIMWAVQHTLEENYYDLTRRLPQNVDLHYDDFLNEQIAAKATIPWEQVPATLRWMYVGQALVDIACCNIIYWQYSALFGQFEVADDIDTLVIYGDGGIFNAYSLTVLIVWSITWALHVGFDMWKSTQTRKERKALCEELRRTEQQWKDNWLKEAEEMERKHQEEEQQREKVLHDMSQARGRLSQVPLAPAKSSSSFDLCKKESSRVAANDPITSINSMVAERGSGALNKCVPSKVDGDDQINDSVSVTCHSCGEKLADEMGQTCARTCVEQLEVIIPSLPPSSPRPTMAPFVKKRPPHPSLQDEEAKDQGTISKPVAALAPEAPAPEKVDSTSDAGRDNHLAESSEVTYPPPLHSFFPCCMTEGL